MLVTPLSSTGNGVAFNDMSVDGMGGGFLSVNHAACLSSE